MIRMHVLRLLLAANLLLACALAALWLPPQRALRQLHWQPPAAQAPRFSDPGSSLPPRSPAPVDSFLATLERPLFAPDRRPLPPAPATAQVPESDPLADILLQGLYHTKGGGGIFARVDGKDRRIAVGDSLGPWTVRSIDGPAVTLARGAETRVLQLLPSRLGATAPSGAAIMPAPPEGASAILPAPPPGAIVLPAPQGAMTEHPVSVEDPVLRQEQERQEHERARLAARNARRAELGFPPVKE